MTIPSFKILKKNAAERLAAAEHSRRIILIYAGITTALAALVTLMNYALGLQIDQAGGLSNMGTRTLLSTVQTVLPMLQSALVLCLELGYLAAMLRISRQQFASENTLKLGFDRFWVMLRLTLLQSGIYMLLGLAALWVAAQIYVLTPLSEPMMEVLTPLLSDSSVSVEALLAETALSDAVMSSMAPLFLLFGALYLLLMTPVSYSLRMARYVVIDQPGRGAAFALRESRMMMKGSRMRLFRLDLSLWWWYALSGGITLLCYGDLLLPSVGISLPWSDTVSYFVFYGLYWAAQFALWVFLRNRVEVVYAQAYNARKPREKDTGVVLGNIFNM